MMGILVLCNIPLNLVNILVTPIILSVGINNGIQIIQLWKQEKNVYTLYGSTSKAILLTTIIIIVMALPILFTGHTGINSTVNVLLVGMGCNLLAHLIILPPLLGNNSLE